MGMSLKILGSSSSGNCALLCTDRCKVLIDAGFSARKLQGMLAEAGESIQDIDAVFLTHEHGDHTAGLKGLARYEGLDIFANEDTARAVQVQIKRPLNWKLFETGTLFSFHDLEVRSFAMPHDAYDPVGFLFSHGGQDLFHPRRTLAWTLDLGYVPNLVREHVVTADVLVLEANHDVALLDADTKRPWSVKQRIKGRHGHLSNQTALEFVKEAANAQWQRLFLAHLSKDCNQTGLVEDLFACLLRKGTPYSVAVVDPQNGTVPTCKFDSL